LFFPVEVTTGGSSIFALFQHPDDIRLRVPSPDVYPTMNRLEDYTRFCLECYSKSEVGNNERKYRLVDVDGKEISPRDFAKKYFSSPEDCFIKDNETLEAEKENLAGAGAATENIAPASNNLYSQNIQHDALRVTNVIEDPTSSSLERYSNGGMRNGNNESDDRYGQQKISPTLWNNVPTEIHKNHLEENKDNTVQSSMSPSQPMQKSSME
jgi:hypothetical protein